MTSTMLQLWSCRNIIVFEGVCKVLVVANEFSSDLVAASETYK